MDYIEVIIILLLSVGFIVCFLLVICYAIKLRKNMSTSATPPQSTALQRSKPMYHSPSAPEWYHGSAVYCPDPTAYSTSCLPGVNELLSRYSEPSTPKKPSKRVKRLLGTVCGQRDEQSERSDTSVNSQVIRCWLKNIENWLKQPGNRNESFGSPAEFSGCSSSLNIEEFNLNNKEFIWDCKSLSGETSES